MNSFEIELNFLNEKIEKKVEERVEIQQDINKMESERIDLNLLLHKLSRKISDARILKSDIKNSDEKISKLRNMRRFIVGLSIILSFYLNPLISIGLGVYGIFNINEKISVEKSYKKCYKMEVSEVKDKMKLLNFKKKSTMQEIENLNNKLKDKKIEYEEINSEISELRNTYNIIFEMYQIMKGNVSEKNSVDEVNKQHAEMLPYLSKVINVEKMFKK